MSENNPYLVTCIKCHSSDVMTNLGHSFKCATCGKVWDNTTENSFHRLRTRIATLEAELDGLKYALVETISALRSNGLDKTADAVLEEYNEVCKHWQPRRESGE
jgi:hypothetical protein